MLGVDAMHGAVSLGVGGIWVGGPFGSLTHAPVHTGVYWVYCLEVLCVTFFLFWVEYFVKFM